MSFNNLFSFCLIDKTMLTFSQLTLIEIYNLDQCFQKSAQILYYCAQNNLSVIKVFLTNVKLKK